MRIGVNLPNYGDLGTRQSITAIAETAEDLGYVSLWTTDHILMPARLPEPYGRLLECVTTLSYLAARTERIGLATSVLVLPQRDPLLVAKQAATLHHLSGGRLTLGVGVGWVEEEFGYLHADFRRRGRFADEFIAAIRELFEADQPSFSGPSISFDDVLFSPKPATRLPIVVGGASEAAFSRAATLGDGWHGIYQTSENVGVIAARLRSESTRPDFEISLRTRLRLGRTIEGVPPGTAIDGSIETAVGAAQAYAAAGVEHLVLDVAADDVDDLIGQLTTFARDVTPRLAEANAN